LCYSTCGIDRDLGLDDRSALQARPFLKWPGGKSWLVEEIVGLIRPLLGNGIYREPFLGGGSVFFALIPPVAVLSDLNSELISCYQTVRDHADDVLALLKPMTVSRKTYYRVRSAIGGSRVQRAARFLYLNRTGFAGMYRLNQRGVFNVPFGGGERTPATLWRDGLVNSASRALASAELFAGDFELSLGEAQPGDIVYCDPTYTVAHENNGFQRYNERIFSWADQQRLARSARKAAARGVSVFISNAWHPSIIALYPDARVRRYRRHTCLCPRVGFRRRVSEALITLSR
jgi:DNA adenine methylase